MMENTQEKRWDMTLTRVFDAPLAHVWQAWSDAELVKRWWGPTGFTAPIARIDFREGGTSLVCMRAPAEFGGMDYYSTWTYSRIEPQARIEFVQRFSDEHGSQIDPASLNLPPGIPSEVPQVVTFRALGDNQTEMTVIEYGYTTEEARALSQAGMAQCLDKMADSLK